MLLPDVTQRGGVWQSCTLGFATPRRRIALSVCKSASPLEHTGARRPRTSKNLWTDAYLCAFANAASPGQSQAAIVSGGEGLGPEQGGDQGKKSESTVHG
jgi:hypothetical protein